MGDFFWRMVYGCRDVLALMSAGVDSPARRFAGAALSTASRKEGGEFSVFKILPEFCDK